MFQWTCMFQKLCCLDLYMFLVCLFFRWVCFVFWKWCIFFFVWRYLLTTLIKPLFGVIFACTPKYVSITLWKPEINELCGTIQQLLDQNLTLMGSIVHYPMVLFLNCRNVWLATFLPAPQTNGMTWDDKDRELSETWHEPVAVADIVLWL